MDKQEQALSAAALDLLKQLRLWAGSLPPSSVVVHENHNPGYGGLLFEVRPARPESMAFTVGLGNSDDVDLFWGDRYRWEGWEASAKDVLETCEAIKQGDVIEETWRLGPFVVERRSYIGPEGHRGEDGSPPMPKWVKRWARLSVRKYSSWLVASICLLILPMLSAALGKPLTAQTTRPGAIMGWWHGTSTCVKASWNSACHDETTVYHFLPTSPDSVRATVQGFKIVQGQQDSMGELPVTFVPATQGWTATFAARGGDDRWNFRLLGDTLMGELISSHGGQVARHVVAVRGGAP